MTYNYGPPPPPPPPPPGPPPAPNAGPGGFPGYGPPAPPAPRGGHGGRGRGGGADRGGYHQPHPGYGYGHGHGHGQQQAGYGAQTPAPYPGPPQPGYQPTGQVWLTEYGQPHSSQGPQHAAAPIPNYHSNYGPQAYHQQQQPAHGAQPQYQPAGQPAYAQPYASPPAYPSTSHPQWGNHHAPVTHGAYGSGGRGGRGGHNDRGGARGQLMGPPIRMGFEGNQLQATPAPPSGPYPYGSPPAPPGPHPAPYAGYAPPPAPYMASPPPFDGHSARGSRPHGRGGFHHNNNRSRHHFGNDRNRARNHHNQNRGPAAQVSANQHARPDGASAGKKKKRKTNTLGLTPGDDSDEDDENEEQRLNEMYGADAPNPKTASEIAAWIAERRAKFPTRARVEARQAAIKTQNGDANLDKAAALEQKAEKLRKKLQKVESSIKRKREQQDEGDEMRDGDLSSPSSPLKSEEDEKPEVMSTRQGSGNVPPPPRKADPTKHCKYFSTGGTCGKRGKCRFVHDPAVREAALKERELNGGRITLRQRLILNDKDQEDLEIVETLKFLQDTGVIPKKTAATKDVEPNPEPTTEPQTEPKPESDAEQSSAQQASVPVVAQSGNGLPPNPAETATSADSTTMYPGWNMGGFGNSGARNNE